MDPIHYDKIADKLIQFYSKLPDESILEYKLAEIEVKSMKLMIENLLKSIDNMARKDENGWIR